MSMSGTSSLLRPSHPTHSIMLAVSVRVYRHWRRVSVPVGGLKGPNYVAGSYFHANKLSTVLPVGTIPISRNREYHLEVVRVLIEISDDGPREPDVRRVGVTIGIAQSQPVPVGVSRVRVQFPDPHRPTALLSGRQKHISGGFIGHGKSRV